MCKMGQFGWNWAGLAALCSRQVPNGSIFLFSLSWVRTEKDSLVRNIQVKNIFVTYFFGISWCVRGQHIRGGGNYNVIYE